MKMKAAMKKNNGFTLLEVLIASVIIFAAIALTAAVYSNSVNSSMKAQRALKITQVLPMMQDSIASEVMLTTDSQLEGQGKFEDVSYEWIAKVSKEDELEQDVMSASNSNRFARLWDIQLSIRYQNIMRVYDYQEFSIK